MNQFQKSNSSTKICVSKLLKLINGIEEEYLLNGRMKSARIVFFLFSFHCFFSWKSVGGLLFLQSSGPNHL